MRPDTDLGLFQLMRKKPIQYMNRLFKPSESILSPGFPKYWTYNVPKEERGFYQKVDLLHGKHVLKNSLWKYYHGNNACTFSIEECYEAFENLSIDLGQNALNFEIDHVEVGVYFHEDFDLIPRLKAAYKNSLFDAMKKSKSREIYGWHLQLTQFEIKIYDVAKKNILAKDVSYVRPGSYRFEIKYFDRNFLRKHGVKKGADLFDMESPIYSHWRQVTGGINFRLFPQLSPDMKTSDIKNIMLYYSDAYSEFNRVLKQKGGGKTDLARVNESVKKSRALLNPKINLNELLLKELNLNLLLSEKKGT
ncbi:hypothetical protein [Roseivirga echinicomitans]|nr:hypothetical protein [Roseivirga echinicomitans]